MDRLALSAAMKPIQEPWSEALALAIENPDRKLAALGADLWNQWDALWTFVDVEGVEPTNNEAERTLRPAVIWRKCCFSTKSGAGSLFVARMLTVTDRRRGVDLPNWLEQAFRHCACDAQPGSHTLGLARRSCPDEPTVDAHKKST
jgi:hypothetical protein